MKDTVYPSETTIDDKRTGELISPDETLVN